MVVLTLRLIHAQATFQTKMPELHLLGPDVLFTPPSQPGSCILFPPQRDLFSGTCLACFLYFCSSVTGPPKSLKHHVYAPDLTITSNTLASKYDVKMNPKGPSIMDPEAHWKPPKTHTPEQRGSAPKCFHTYSIRLFSCKSL